MEVGRPSPQRHLVLALALLALVAFMTPQGAFAADIANCTVTVKSAVYSGEPLYPDLVVRDGGDALELGVDYVTAWRKNVNAGAGSVTVTGRGPYTGRKTVFFDIARARMAQAGVGGIEGSYPHTGRAVEPKPVVTFSGRKLEEGLDYSVAYRDNVAPGTACIVITGKRNLVGQKTVEFKIAAAEKPSIAGAAVTVDGATYTGSALKPAVSVTLGGKRLSAGKDYEVSYRDNVNAGRGRAVITGKGGYTGRKEAPFEISQRNINQAEVAAISTQTYTGKKITPKPKVRYGGKTLAEKRDYELVYQDNVKAGTAKATVRGMGNFAGSKTVKFAIAEDPGARIAAAAVALAGGWTKDNRAPGPTGNGKHGGWSAAQKAPPDTKKWRGQKWDWRLYKKVYRKVNAIRPGGRIHHACCDCLVTLAVLWSGVDDGFINDKWPTVAKERTYFSKSSKWTRVGGTGKYWHTNGGAGYGDAGVELRPGDILVSRKEDERKFKHVMVYVGHEAAAKRWGESTKVVLVDEGHGSRWANGKPMSSRGKASWIVYRRNADSLDTAKSKYAGIYRSSLEKYLVG